MEVSENKRIAIAINQLKVERIIESKAELFKKIGYSNGYLGDISRKDMRVSADFLRNLLKYYPINPKYIYDGEEPILLKVYINQDDAPKQSVINSNGDGNNNSINNGTQNMSDALIQMYEARLRDKDEMIATLKERVEEYKTIIDGILTRMEGRVDMVSDSITRLNHDMAIKKLHQTKKDWCS